MIASGGNDCLPELLIDMPYLFFFAICSIWGANFLMMKRAVLAFTPLQVGIGRITGGAVVLLLIWFWQRGKWSFRKRDLWPTVFIVLVGYAWPYCLQPWLVRLHGSALVGISVSFVPLFTILLSIPLLAVRPSRRQLIGVSGALVGLSLILMDGLKRSVPAGDILLAGSIPLGYAIANITIRSRLQHIPSLELSWLALVASFVPMLPALAWDETAPVAYGATWWGAIACIGVLGVIGTGLANWMFNVLVQQQGPLFAGMVTNLVPLGALLWAWMDGEVISSAQVYGVMIVLSMVLLVQYGAARAPAPQPLRIPDPTPQPGNP